MGDFFLKKAQEYGAHYGSDNQGCQIQQRMFYHREDEDSAVGRHKSTSKGHGKGSGYGRTDDAGRQNVQGIGGGEGNGALCDKGKSHDEVYRAGFPFLFGEFVFK